MAAYGRAKSDGAGSRIDDPWRIDDLWRIDEESRRRQPREDARRPLAANLAAGLALSGCLSGSARKS
jgi:hypothetical protein